MPKGEENRPTLHTVKAFEEQRDYKALLLLLAPENSAAIRQAAARSLARIAPGKVAAQLGDFLLHDPDRGVRRSLAETLGRLGDDSGLPALLQTLKDRELQVREEAARALARFNSQTAFEALLQALQLAESPEPERANNWLVRRFAAEALGLLGDRRAVPILIEALKDEHALVRPAAAQALGRLGDISAVGPLKRARHTTPHQRGAECAECAAIDSALKMFERPKE